MIIVKQFLQNIKIILPIATKIINFNNKIQI